MKRQKYDLNRFKVLAKTGNLPEHVITAKSYTCEVKSTENIQDNQLQFTISTGVVDRDNDTISPSGFVNLDTFPETGVVLWAHDARLPPIAKPIKVWVEDDKVKSIAEFAPADLNHPLGMGFGETIRRSFELGFMKSVSIGFAPTKWQFSHDRKMGIDFEEQELLEFSAVPIPANPQALVELAHNKVDMRGIYQWAVKCLDGGVNLLVPRNEIEQACKGLAEVYDGNKSIVDMGAAMKTKKGAISYNQAHPEGTPVADPEEDWNGPEEIAMADIEALMVMCAWKKELEEGEEATKGDFKLPHHKADGEHVVVWRGVTAAMAALLGSRGGVDIPDVDMQGVYDHLAKHYRDDFDQEPPEFKMEESEIEEDSDSFGDTDDIEPEEEQEFKCDCGKVEQKRGRVLSKNNEKKLKQALELLQEVLGQLEEEEIEIEAEEEGKEFEELEKVLSALIGEKKEKEKKSALNKITPDLLKSILKEILDEQDFGFEKYASGKV